MKLTNKLNLPSAIQLAILNDDYSKRMADFSVTELLQPPQISALLATHDEVLETDVSDEIFKLLGKSVHSILEKAGASDLGVLSETIIVEEFEGVKIKGQMDYLYLAEGLLQDFKITTVWKFLSDERLPEDWYWQLNIYAWMLRRRGIKVNRAEIVGILRDWSRPEAERRQDYPKQQVAVAEVALAEDAVVEDFLRKQIKEHQDAKLGSPRECTPHERWIRAAKYVVIKTGGVRATATFDYEADAKTKLAELAASKPKDKYEIQHRPGSPVRCQLYCPVSRYCPQYNSLLDKPMTSQNLEI